MFNLEHTTFKMVESELQHIYHIDKSINERLRSHHGIDSEMEREIKGKEEMKKRKNTKNEWIAG